VNRSLTILVYAGILALQLTACAPEVHRSTAELGIVRAPGDLIEQMQGQWKMHLQLSSDCPAAWQNSLPLGETRWIDTGEQLVIESTEGHGFAAKLWLTSPQSLESTHTVSVEGCDATEDLALVVDSVSGHYATGLYTSRITHNGSPCQALVKGPALPEQCETIMHWQAQRIAPGH